MPSAPVTVLEPVIGTERYGRLLTVATQFRNRLGHRTIWNVNSTAVGGGVAEMLQVLVGYIAGLGIAVRWTVISGDPDFFAITKRLHNQIHGVAGDSGKLDGSDARHYEQVLAANADELLRQVLPGDIVLLHDPQTAGLVAPLVRAGARVVWRCHIGVDWQNDATRWAWDFLRPYVTHADGYVFTPAAVRAAVDPPGTSLGHPAIDRPVLREESGTRRRNGSGDPGHCRGIERRCAAGTRAFRPPRRDNRRSHSRRAGDGRRQARPG